jgi:hypothetical protein
MVSLAPIVIGPIGMVMVSPSGVVAVTEPASVTLVVPVVMTSARPVSPSGQVPGVMVGRVPSSTSTVSVTDNATPLNTGVVWQSSSMQSSAGTLGSATGPTVAEMVFVTANAWADVATSMAATMHNSHERRRNLPIQPPFGPRQLLTSQVYTYQVCTYSLKLAVVEPQGVHFLGPDDQILPGNALSRICAREGCQKLP